VTNDSTFLINAGGSLNVGSNAKYTVASLITNNQLISVGRRRR
jgi:hypothetical protein